MRFTDKLKTIKDKVKFLLEKYSGLRDDDNKLVSSFWYYELNDKGKNVEQLTGLEVLKLLSNKNIASFESISRCRRKLQEQNPDLRGKHYVTRKSEEEHTRKNIHSV